MYANICEKNLMLKFKMVHKSCLAFGVGMGRVSNMLP